MIVPLIRVTLEGVNEEQVNQLKMRWEAEKETLSSIQPLKEEIDHLRTEYEQAFNRARQSNLNEDYIKAQQVEQQLKNAESRLVQLEDEFQKIQD